MNPKTLMVPAELVPFCSEAGGIQVFLPVGVSSPKPLGKQ